MFLVQFIISIFAALMIADWVKSNAVLDGVTSFLKYGTLDSSNSDVSTTMWVENTTRQSLRVPDVGWEKNLQGPLQWLILGVLERKNLPLVVWRLKIATC